MAAQDRPAFSRNAESAPFGKMDDRIEGFKIESAVKDALIRKAGKKGLTEFLRTMCRIAAFGSDEVKRVTNDDIDRVAKMLRE
jgi:hypothetical protein